MRSLPGSGGETHILQSQSLRLSDGPDRRSCGSRKGTPRRTDRRMYM
jgi:hypothetical protein